MVGNPAHENFPSTRVRRKKRLTGVKKARIINNKKNGVSHAKREQTPMFIE
jgi:hypothetical protein